MRLTKSREDIVLSGLLGGLGEYFNIDPTLLRIGFVILMFVGVGAVVPLYILGAILVPSAPSNKRSSRRDANRGRESNRTRERRPRDVDRRPRRDVTEPDEQRGRQEKTNNIDEDDWSDF